MLSSVLQLLCKDHSVKASHSIEKERRRYLQSLSLTDTNKMSLEAAQSGLIRVLWNCQILVRAFFLWLGNTTPYMWLVYSTKNFLRIGVGQKILENFDYFINQICPKWGNLWLYFENRVEELHQKGQTSILSDWTIVIVANSFHVLMDLLPFQNCEISWSLPKTLSLHQPFIYINPLFTSNISMVYLLLARELNGTKQKMERWEVLSFRIVKTPHEGSL